MASFETALPEKLINLKTPTTHVDAFLQAQNFRIFNFNLINLTTNKNIQCSKKNLWIQNPCAVYPSYVFVKGMTDFFLS